MSGAQWRMFNERGAVGLGATSMVTRTIAALGLYIGQVERSFGLQPVFDPVSQTYHLSEKDLAQLKERDPNAFQKYQSIRYMQTELRKLYPEERKIDPNHTTLQRDFKHTLFKLLSVEREGLYQEHQWKVDMAKLTSDNAAALAYQQVSDFEWPNDHEGRRYGITEKDQMVSDPKQQIIVDFSKEPPSAAGSKVFATTAGCYEAT